MSDQQASSTDTSASADLKAGHAPAIKVGGMRVGASRPRHTSQGEDKDKNAAADDAEGGQETSGENTTEGQGSATKEATDEGDEQQTAVAHRALGEMVSGTFVPIQEAFPTEAVRQIHDKPGTHPKNEPHTRTKHNDQKFIIQPRKQ